LLIIDFVRLGYSFSDFCFDFQMRNSRSFEYGLSCSICRIEPGDEIFNLNIITYGSDCVLVKKFGEGDYRDCLDPKSRMMNRRLVHVI
jgi:hypothetical protein